MSRLLLAVMALVACAPPEGRAQEEELLGRLVARGSYEIRSIATDSLLGEEGWELFEDDAGFRTLRATASLEVDGIRSSRAGSVTVGPELQFVQADVGSTMDGLETYATYRRAGDVLTVEAFSGASGETRQEVRFPEDAVFTSQLFATRGWELAPFGRDDDDRRPAYLAGSAPGVLVGEMRTLRAELEGRDQVQLPAGRFNVQRFTIPLPVPAQGSGGDVDARDAWWVLPETHIPVAAELLSLGVRVTLRTFEPNPEPAASSPGPVLARGIYHHRPLRGSEPLAVERWSLAAGADGGYLLTSEITYADGRALTVRTIADAGFHVREIQARRRMARSGESMSWKVTDVELQAEARGGGVGFARQRFELDGPPVFRLETAALEGWAVPAGAPSDSAAKVPTYWLPAGDHPLGTLLALPPEVDLGEERLATPARTFTVRRYASPPETPQLLRTVRWVFGIYRLPARVLFPALGREAILVSYETPE